MKKRTPRNYSGINSPVKKMSELLPEFMVDLNKMKGDQKEIVFQFWHQILGEKMAPMTEPISFFDGVLTVKVKSSTLYSLLTLHEKPRLIARLQEKFSIRDLVFRIG